MKKITRRVLALLLLGSLTLTGGIRAEARERTCLDGWDQGMIPVSGAAEAPETMNVLLIGQDRKPEDQGSRSDSMILCSICPEEKSMTMVSILRDLYVEIPGYGKNRVNAAYAFGGPELLEKTLRNNLGIRVMGSVEVDFANFSKLMDLLGGVPMELRKDEAGEINRVVPGSDLHGGSAVLTGEQALAYARIRRLDPDSDVSRSQRQRKVLEQIYSQYRTASPGELIRVMAQALPMMTFNMKKSELLRVANALLPIMGQLQVKSLRIPAPGTYRDLTVNNMAVLDADLPANRQLLQEILNP